MRSPEQVRWDVVQQWLGKAEQDLAAARRTSQEQGQEALLLAEKAQGLIRGSLKAYLNAGRPEAEGNA